MTVFDAIKNGIASVGDPFKQFDGAGFQQSGLTKLSPLGGEGMVNVTHILVYKMDALAASSPFDSVR